MRITEIQLVTFRGSEIRAVIWGVSERQRMVALDVELDIRLVTKLRHELLQRSENQAESNN